MLHIHPLATKIIGGKNDNIVFVYDHMPEDPSHAIEYDYETGSVFIDQDYNTINPIIEKYNYQTSYIFGESYIKWNSLENFYPVPAYFLYECEKFLKCNIGSTDYTDSNRVICMMNNPRPHRLLVSAWVKHNLDPTTVVYTQSWDENYDQHRTNLDELVRQTEYQDLNTMLPRNFLPFKNNSPETYSKGTSNAEIFFQLLQPYYNSSTFSIITEPSFYEKAAAITEKYLMSIYGCCFPIFCGGYGMADALTDIGFDVFPDLIDHSYQYIDHPTLRVLDALKLNKPLLTSNTIKKTDYIDRHMKNLQLVREGYTDLRDTLFKDIIKLSATVHINLVLREYHALGFKF